MIELKNITKSFDHLVLDNLNLTLKEGNIYIIKGISGSGKTTLFNILSFLDTNYKGNYYWDKKDVKNCNKQYLQNIKNSISYVFQKSYLFNKLTIKENLLFIKNDIDKIKDYAKKFDVENLLDKKPEEISGGEKQRIALIRALLLDSKLIILDEPTSSLDKKNSEIFCNYLKELISPDKIIIIATHKDIFDNISNCIYKMEFGTLHLIKEKLNKKPQNESALIDENKIQENNNKIQAFSKYDWLFVKKRKNKRIMFMFVIALFFLLIFSSISIIENLKKEAILRCANLYPLHVLNVTIYDLPSIKYDINKKYYNYHISGSDYEAYILLDSNDSHFNNKNMIKIGKFPTNDNEILINEEFALSKFGDDYNNIIGKKITIKDTSFKVSGIIFGRNGYLYPSNEIYNEIIDDDSNVIKPAVFIPYDTMAKIGTLDDDENIIISIPKKDAVDIYASTSSNYIQFYNIVRLNYLSNVKNKVFTIYNYVKIGIAIGIIFLIFIFVFMISKILLELYYNKKQIGYLKLYRVSNNRIHLLFLFDYFIEIVLAFLLAFIIFNLICTIIYLGYHWNFYLSFKNWAIIIFLSFIYFYSLVTIPVIKYLKKDILQCIASN